MTTWNAYVELKDGTTEVIKDMKFHECKGGFISIYKNPENKTLVYDIIVYSNMYVNKVTITSVGIPLS